MDPNYETIKCPNCGSIVFKQEKSCKNCGKTIDDIKSKDDNDSSNEKNNDIMAKERNKQTERNKYNKEKPYNPTDDCKANLDNEDTHK